jgi:hypothetical protein
MYAGAKVFTTRWLRVGRQSLEHQSFTTRESITSKRIGQDRLDRVFLCCTVARLWRGYLPRRPAGRPMGPNVDPQDPQAEQRNPPHTSGNGVSATKRGSRAATGIVVLWWQSRHETDSSPGPVIRSASVGGPVIDRYSTDGAITVAAPGRSVSNNRSSGIEAPTTSA